MKSDEDNKANESDAAKTIITNEEQETKGVPWSSYFAYILSLIPSILVIPFLLYYSTGEGLSVFS